MITWEKRGSCRRYDEVPNGARVTSVNGREVIGYCESCGMPILDGQASGRDIEGVTWHMDCPSPIKYPKNKDS